MVCELELEPHEVHLLVNNNFSGHPKFIKSQIEDEDGKTITEYANAIGQKIATLQYGTDLNK